jgi:cytochrome c2
MIKQGKMHMMLMEQEEIQQFVAYLKHEVHQKQV